jgi:hypothetical protein
MDCRPDALPRSEVLLGCLNRDVAKQKLDLIQLAARTPTEPSAGSPQNHAAQVQEYLLLRRNTSLRAKSLFR